MLPDPNSKVIHELRKLTLIHRKDLEHVVVTLFKACPGNRSIVFASIRVISGFEIVFWV